ncbi:MAG TPA: DHHA1 domain-containing protein [Thermoanaerobaculia bacterium]|nr:DHHA1 domain-containing protein [Thermoanaerobaculia bacterium]
MKLIATHLGADFDAFGSMIAARRLHPGAELFFPGSREEPLRRMLATGFVELSELKQRQVDPDRLDEVVLCDSRQRRRLGVLGDWLAERPGLPVIAYDHHPESEDDLPVRGGRIDPTVGATATLMVEELVAHGLEPSAVEATLLLLGLHEDTGSLTYGATSPRDHRAAGWLLERGGDLSAVRRWATSRLDPLHLEVLHRMMRDLEVVRLSGHRVGIVALELGEYVDELAPLVSRAIELADLPLLFALFGDGEHVQVIARGDVERVDLGDVLGALGGGGHRTAAAARLHDQTVLEVRERLLAVLTARLPPAARARDLGIADFFVVAAGTTVARAKEQLVERRVNAAPVAAAGEDPSVGAVLVGAVTRQMLDAALQHGLGDRTVERVMAAELEWVPAEAAAEEVARRMLTRHPRFVLVGDPAERRASGLISRMHVLRHLHARLAAEEVSLDRGEPLRVHRESAAKLLAGLSQSLARRVEVAARLSRRHDVAVYLVGGLVRDLLLGRDNRDLDLVVEGDGPAFAHRLAAELGGRVREHRAFLTAVVVDAEGMHIDVATARSEFYRQPAALPEVATSALRQDLYRRDFTINTLAIRLGPAQPPELIDHFGGRRDLEDGVIRVLHSLSVLDDPTRVLRAVRLEQRLGFEIAAETLHLVEVALEEGAFDLLSGSRLRDELVQILDDPAVALAGLERLEELGLLAVLHPQLRLDEAVRRRLVDGLGAFHWFRLQGLAEPEVELWRLLLVALTLDLEPERVERLAERLMLAGGHREVVVGAGARLAAARDVLSRPRLAPHEICEALADSPGEDLLLLLAAGPEPVRERVRRDLTELRAFDLEVRGADLVAAGIEPGPAIGEALRATWAARLDGEIGPDEELAFARDEARRRAGVTAPVAIGEER